MIISQPRGRCVKMIKRIRERSKEEAETKRGEESKGKGYVRVCLYT